LIEKSDQAVEFQGSDPRCADLFALDKTARPNFSQYLKGLAPKKRKRFAPIKISMPLREHYYCGECLE